MGFSWSKRNQLQGKWNGQLSALPKKILNSFEFTFCPSSPLTEAVLFLGNCCLMILVDCQSSCFYSLKCISKTWCNGRTVAASTTEQRLFWTRLLPIVSEYMFHVGFFSPPGIQWHDFTFRIYWHFLWPKLSKEKKEETFLHLTKKPKGNLNKTLKKI